MYFYAGVCEVRSAEHPALIVSHAVVVTADETWCVLHLLLRDPSCAGEVPSLDDADASLGRQNETDLVPPGGNYWRW